MSFLKSFKIGKTGETPVQFIAQTATDLLMPKTNDSDPDVTVAEAITAAQNKTGGNANFELDEQDHRVSVNNNVQYLSMDFNDQDTLYINAYNPGSYLKSRTVPTKDYVDSKKSLPNGGATEQILAKASDTDGDAEWVEDIGRSLTRFDRKYGVAPATVLITTRVAELVNDYTEYRVYRVPFGGIIASRSSINDVLNTFDAYVTVSGYSESRINEYVTAVNKYRLENSLLVRFEDMSVQGNYAGIKTVGNDDRKVTGIRLVARGNNNFGMGDGLAPYDIRNLTGMVLDDLKVTGNAVPTDWGIATVAKISISMSAGQSATQTIDVSGFGFESADDYTVSCNIRSGTGDWAKAITNAGNKNATSFMLIVKPVASDITRVDVEYTIFAKGYGNNTMQGGGSSSSGQNYSTTEQAVGTWVDGKTIYQKTMVCAMPSNVVDGTMSSTYVPHGVSDIEQIIDCQSVAKATAGNVGGDPGNYCVQFNNMVLCSAIQANSYQINLATNVSTYSDKEYYVTFKYTKTV